MNDIYTNEFSEASDDEGSKDVMGSISASEDESDKEDGKVIPMRPEGGWQTCRYVTIWNSIRGTPIKLCGKPVCKLQTGNIPFCERCSSKRSSIIVLDNLEFKLTNKGKKILKKCNWTDEEMVNMIMKSLTKTEAELRFERDKAKQDRLIKEKERLGILELVDKIKELESRVLDLE
jgi:hypothetical protein